MATNTTTVHDTGCTCPDEEFAGMSVQEIIDTLDDIAREEAYAEQDERDRWRDYIAAIRF